jgi:hypothetical protein
VRTATNDSLLDRVHPVFLRSNQVEESFSTSVQRMQFSIVGTLRILLFMLVEDGEKEWSMVQCAILDGVVQFGDLANL